MASPLPAVEEIFRRRVRCSTCQACHITEDCNECLNCVARLRYNETKEPSARRRVCVMRDCLRPQLSVNATCDECGKDGWGEGPNAFQIMGKIAQGPSTLMECIMCLKVVHPLCISSEVCTRSVAIVNEDLPNSWECPMCVDKSKPIRGIKRIKSQEDEKRNHIIEAEPSQINGILTDVKLLTNGTATPILNGKPIMEQIIVRQDISDNVDRLDENLVRQKIDQVVRRKSTEESMKAAANKVSYAIKRTLSATEVTKAKQPRRLSEVEENVQEEKLSIIIKKDNHIQAVLPTVIKQEPKSDLEMESSENSDGEPKPKASPVKYPFRNELSGKIIVSSGKNLKKPSNVVRPAPLTLPDEEARKASKKKAVNSSSHNVMKEPKIWLNVFKWLDLPSLNRVLCVSKDWNRIGVTSCLWEKIDLTER